MSQSPFFKVVRASPGRCKMCKSYLNKLTSLHEDDIQGHIPADSSNPGGAKCSLCKTAVEKLDEIIGNDKSEAKIRHGLEEVCHAMPHPIRKKCKKYVDEYSAEIIELIVQDLNPSQVRPHGLN